jgi:hypothetical protein
MYTKDMTLTSQRIPPVKLAGKTKAPGFLPPDAISFQVILNLNLLPLNKHRDEYIGFMT